MAILTKPTIAKGQPNEIDLSKSELAAISKVVNDSYFSDQTNWSKVIVEYKSAEGNQHEMMIFDATGDSPKGNFEVSEKAKDSWEVQSVKIMDFDGGYLKLVRGDLTVADFDIALGSVGGSVGAVYSSFNYVTTLIPDDLAYSYRFGWCVSISGNYFVVSSFDESDSGSAYVFKINVDGGVTLLEKLRADVITSSDNFGASVSIDGEYIVVGAYKDERPYPDRDSGAAYVFKINGDDTITLLDTLRPGELDSHDNFGISVSISGNYIVVGAYNDDGIGDNKSNSGAAYVFKINGDDTITLLQDTLRPDGLDAGDLFGRNVAISGNYIVVGVYNDDGIGDNKSNSGAAYVFKINGDDTITLLDTLRPGELDAGDGFGRSVAISGNYIVVGATGDNNIGNIKSDSGAAYVFKINGDDTITLLDILRPDGLKGYDEFGICVSICDNYIVASSAYDSGINNTPSSGAAYVFKINGDDTITLLNTLRPDGLESYDYFGWSVAIGGEYIIAGAYGDDGTSQDSGAAYLFKGVE